MPAVVLYMLCNDCLPDPSGRGTKVQGFACREANPTEKYFSQTCRRFGVVQPDFIALS